MSYLTRTMWNARIILLPTVNAIGTTMNRVSYEGQIFDIVHSHFITCIVWFKFEIKLKIDDKTYQKCVHK